MCGFFKRNCLGHQQFIPPTQSLLFFAARSCGDLYPGTVTLCSGSPGMGLGLLTPKISLSNFYPLHVGEGPAHFVSLPLLPVQIDVVSSIPYLSDFHSA